jgi:hypothetical protein
MRVIKEQQCHFVCGVLNNPYQLDVRFSVVVHSVVIPCFSVVKFSYVYVPPMAAFVLYQWFYSFFVRA